VTQSNEPSQVPAMPGQPHPGSPQVDAHPAHPAHPAAHDALEAHAAAPTLQPSGAAAGAVAGRLGVAADDAHALASPSRSALANTASRPRIIEVKQGSILRRYQASSCGQAAAPSTRSAIRSGQEVDSKGSPNV
jgi:hypothetical protein